MATPSSTTIVIPAYNEAASIGEVVRALADAGAWQEILVVDDVIPTRRLFAMRLQREGFTRL